MLFLLFHGILCDTQKIKGQEFDYSTTLHVLAFYMTIFVIFYLRLVYIHVQAYLTVCLIKMVVNKLVEKSTFFLFFIVKNVQMHIILRLAADFLKSTGVRQNTGLFSVFVLLFHLTCGKCVFWEGK